MMKNSSARLMKTVKIVSLPLLLALVLTGCGTKKEAVGLHQTGTVAFMLNYDSAAETYFEKALDADPMYAPSYIMLGDCYLRQGKNKEAIEVIQKGFELELDEGHKRLAHRKLARAYKELGKPEKALEHIIIYTRMSVYQDKMTQQKITDTELFIEELNLPEDLKYPSVTQVIEETTKAKESSKAAQENESNILDVFDIM